MPKKYNKRSDEPTKKEINTCWHYENDLCQAICRERSPLFNTYMPNNKTTKTAKHVTCKRCLQLMAERGIK